MLIGSTLHIFPTSSITLKWTHTVEKTPWEEDYRIVDDALMIEEARVKTSGAGMEPPADAIWVSGWWRYKPSTGLLKEVILANSEFAPGYTICRINVCQSIRELGPPGEFARIVPARCGGVLEKDQAVHDAIVER